MFAPEVAVTGPVGGFSSTPTISGHGGVDSLVAPARRKSADGDHPSGSSLGSTRHRVKYHSPTLLTRVDHLAPESKVEGRAMSQRARWEGLTANLQACGSDSALRKKGRQRRFFAWRRGLVAGSINRDLLVGRGRGCLIGFTLLPSLCCQEVFLGERQEKTDP